VTGPEDDVTLVRQWLQRLQLHVQSVDFVGARALFTDDMITFGSFNSFTVGREAAEAEQWRTVWGRIDHFDGGSTNCEPSSQATVSRQRPWLLFDSTGYTETGTPYERPGRATVVLGRTAVGQEWIAQHMHVSLFRDVPVRSFGSKPEHAPAL
jgi:ketosteroid isomerase-like protein